MPAGNMAKDDIASQLDSLYDTAHDMDSRPQTPRRSGVHFGMDGAKGTANDGAQPQHRNSQPRRSIMRNAARPSGEDQQHDVKFGKETKKGGNGEPSNPDHVIIDIGSPDCPLNDDGSRRQDFDDRSSRAPGDADQAIRDWQEYLGSTEGSQSARTGRYSGSERTDPTQRSGRTSAASRDREAGEETNDDEKNGTANQGPHLDSAVDFEPPAEDAEQVPNTVTHPSEEDASSSLFNEIMADLLPAATGQETETKSDTKTRASSGRDQKALQFMKSRQSSIFLCL